MAIHPMSPSLLVAFGRSQLLIAVAATLCVVTFGPLAREASAKAPPLATAILDAEVLAAPGDGATQVAVIPRGRRSS